MTRRKFGFVLSGKFARNNAQEMAEIIDELKELATDMYHFSLYVGRLNDRFKKRHPSHDEARKLLERVRERMSDYYADLEALLTAYQTAIDGFEHVNGPVFYDKQKVVFEVGIPIGQLFGQDDYLGAEVDGKYE